MNAIRTKTKHLVFTRNAGSRAIDAATQRGATLLEAIAFLGIAAIVVLGAVSMLSSAFSNADVDKANNEIIGLRIGIKKLYSNSSGYGVVDANMLPAIVSAKILPGTLTNTGTEVAPAVKNGWAGDVTVVSKLSSFTIKYANIPKAACIGLLTASGQNMWLSIKATGDAVLVFPITPEVAAGATACTSENANTITYEAR